MRDESNSRMNTNEILIEIRRLKKELEILSWLLGDEELKHKVIKALEEKENDVLEHLMWLA